MKSAKAMIQLLNSSFLRMLIGWVLMLSSPSIVFGSIESKASETDLTLVDDFLQAEVFENAFIPSEQTLVETKSCLGNYCDQPYNTAFWVESVFLDQAKFQRTKMDGTPISHETITKADWLAMKQNRVRVEIRGLESAGLRVSITGIENSQAKVLLNGEAVTIETRVVGLDAVSVAGLKLQETVEVAPGLGGLSQIVKKVINRGSMGIDTFTVVKVTR